VNGPGDDGAGDRERERERERERGYKGLGGTRFISHCRVLSD